MKQNNLVRSNLTFDMMGKRLIFNDKSNQRKVFDVGSVRYLLENYKYDHLDNEELATIVGECYYKYGCQFSVLDLAIKIKNEIFRQQVKRFVQSRLENFYANRPGMKIRCFGKIYNLRVLFPNGWSVRVEKLYGFTGEDIKQVLQQAYDNRDHWWVRFFTFKEYIDDYVKQRAVCRGKFHRFERAAIAAQIEKDWYGQELPSKSSVVQLFTKNRGKYET